MEATEVNKGEEKNILIWSYDVECIGHGNLSQLPLEYQIRFKEHFSSHE